MFAPSNSNAVQSVRISIGVSTCFYRKVSNFGIDNLHVEILSSTIRQFPLVILDNSTNEVFLLGAGRNVCGDTAYRVREGILDARPTARNTCPIENERLSC